MENKQDRGDVPEMVERIAVVIRAADQLCVPDDLAQKYEASDDPAMCRAVFTATAILAAVQEALEDELNSLRHKVKLLSPVAQIVMTSDITLSAEDWDIVAAALVALECERAGINVALGATK